VANKVGQAEPFGPNLLIIGQLGHGKLAEWACESGESW